MSRVQRTANKAERFWEILPGALEWLTFILLFVLSWQAPFVVSYFIMLYSLVWLEKTVHSSAHLFYTYGKLRRSHHEYWPQRLHDLEDIPKSLARVEVALESARNKQVSGFKARRSLRRERRQLERRIVELTALKGRADLIPWRSVWHVMLLPTYNEPTEVLIQSIQAIERSRYPLDRIFVVVGLEERAGPEGKEKGRLLQERFGRTFGGFMTTVHPDGIAGEHKGKSANATYSLWKFIPELKRRGIDLQRVLVSNFDADTQPHPDYLSVLTEAFVTNSNRLRNSYQPVPVFNNNIWEAPMMARLSGSGTSFWQMIESSRTHRLVSFSSHAIPLQAVMDVKGWDVTRISEDSRIFWQCYMRYLSEYSVVPLAATVSMDAVQDTNWRKTLVALYKQKRRWAWGVENLSYLGTNFYGKKKIKIAWHKKLVQISRMIEGHHSWGTTAIVLALGGWLPSKLGGSEFTNTVLGQNYLQVTRFLLTSALMGILVSIVISSLMLPKRPAHVPFRRSAALFVQWILTPFVTIFFGSLPALDAHGRLALGRYMEFQVTPKVLSPAQKNAPPA
jgi:cellulose synthase/poly-beta-1,6-N-acetylglucosamine synthase-like glycosyltransferase